MPTLSFTIISFTYVEINYSAYGFTLITPCFRTPFVVGHPLFFTDIIIFSVRKHVFGHPLFADTPIFHRNFFSVRKHRVIKVHIFH